MNAANSKSRGLRASGWPGILLQVAGLLVTLSVGLRGQQATGVIYGRVTDARGHPQSLLVRLLAEGDVPAGDVYTDAEGQYLFRSLPSGEYWVVAEAEGFQPVRQPVMLDAHTNPKMQANVVLETLVTYAKPSPIVAGSASSYKVDAQKAARAFDPRALREFNKGNTRQKQGDLKGAVSRYEKAVIIDPQLYPALNNLGAIYERQGNHEKAERALLRALEINPNDGEIYVNLGHALYEEGRYEEARVRLEAGVKRSPNLATGRFYLGSTELKLGDLAAAKSNLKQACVLDPKGMSSAHLQLANAYLRARDLPAAGTELENYLRANPNDPQAPAMRKLLASIKAPSN